MVCSTLAPPIPVPRADPRDTASPVVPETAAPPAAPDHRAAGSSHLPRLWSKPLNWLGSEIIGRSAANAKACFAAARDADKSWASRIWNGIKAAGWATLTGVASIPTLAMGIVISSPLIAVATAAGAVAGFFCAWGHPVGGLVGAAAGGGFVLGIAIHALGAGAAMGFERYASVQQSRPEGHAYFRMNECAEPTPA